MFKIEPISKHHDRKSFNCGIDELNQYLQHYARQHSKKGMAQTFVISNETHKILGFYSLSAHSIKADIAGLPNQIPCILLGRLAVDNGSKGLGVSKYLIANLFERIKKISYDLGVMLVLVDLKNLSLVKFYEYFGFKQIQTDSLTMYLKISDI